MLAVYDAIDLMMTVSDNTATNLPIARVGPALRHTTSSPSAYRTRAASTTSASSRAPISSLVPSQ
jgi:beta-lactamase class A